MTRVALHSSGANAERIAYFLGTKPRGLLSSKTDADGLDSRLATLRKRLGGRSVGGEVHRRGAEGAPLQSWSMQQAPATTVASRPRTGRVADSASVAQAEAIIVRGLSRITPASKKMAGFQTVRGRHLTLQRDVQGIQVWTEDLDPPEPIAPLRVLRSPSIPTLESCIARSACRHRKACTEVALGERDAAGGADFLVRKCLISMPGASVVFSLRHPTAPGSPLITRAACVARHSFGR